MSWQWPNPYPIRVESHFGDRLVRCFAQRPPHVDAMFHDVAARYPEADAIVGPEGDRMSYRTLDAQVQALAGNLAQQGVQARDRIAILLSNRPEFVTCLLAAARLNAIAVPLNSREQTPELEYTISHCGAKALIHEANLAERLPQASTTPALQLRYAVGGAASGSMPFTDLLRDAAQPAPPPVNEEDVAVILYTSGTTGRPKGAMLTHFNLIHSILHYEVCMGLNPGERSLLAVPASHVTGVVAIILVMMRCGGAVVMMRDFKARPCLEMLAHERVTHTIMVPAMYNLCLMDPEFDRFDLQHMRVGGYGGAPMPQATIAALAQKLPKLTLVNAYGSTETTSPTTCMPPGEGAQHSDTVGQVVPCADVRVMDGDGREVAPGEPGELWIGGPMVVKGYWNNPQATAQAFTAGYWHSGDIGSVGEDGFVRIFDRMKDLVNRGGYKVYSIEVENALKSHPQVVECAVVPQPDPVLGEKIHAFVVRKDPTCDAESLKNLCRKHLSDYKVPDFITFQDEPLPRNANGKVLKRALRDRLPT